MPEISQPARLTNPPKCGIVAMYPRGGLGVCRPSAPPQGAPGGKKKQGDVRGRAARSRDETPVEYPQKIAVTAVFRVTKLVFVRLI